MKNIAPNTERKKIKEGKIDPGTRSPMRDADGNAIMEKKTMQIPMFKPDTVFDVSQTYGKPLPELASDLTGNVQNYAVFMEALKRSAPVPVTIEPMSESMDGYFSTEKQCIAIREGMGEIPTVCATVHEIAHSKLHNRNTQTEDNALDRNTEEVQAESISYAGGAY